MAEIKPFRGLRYNQARVGNLAAVISPPYDVISAEKQQQYHAQSPYNVIRLELGETFPDDDAENNRYTRARRCLDAWLAEGILVPEEAPAFYLYRQYFKLGGHTRPYHRNGLIAALKTTPYEEGIVLPHEDTLPRAKADRLAMLETCKTNFSSIFVLYHDEQGQVAALLQPCFDRPPAIDVTDEESVRHQLWCITDPTTVQALQEAFAPKRLYIADGHHRYETACQFARTAGPEAGYVMTTLVDINDAGLIVQPTHRLVRGVGPIPWDLLAANFERHSFPYLELAHSPSPVNDFLNTMEQFAAQKPCFGVYAGGDTLDLLMLRRLDILEQLPGDQPMARKELDVSILHELFLKPAFGLGSAEIASQEYVTYTRDPREAWQGVHDHQYAFAVFLNPPRLEQIAAVSLAGARMPQKSTYFWPKLVTGLVMHRFGA